MIETLLFMLLSAALCVLRALVSLWAVDPATGFYEGYASLIFAQDVLLITGAACFIIWAGMQAKSKWSFPNAWVRGLPLAVAGAALTVCSGILLIRDLFRFTEGDSSAGLSGIAAQAFGIAAGLAMAGAAWRLCRKKKRGSGILPAALPALYMAFMAVSRFLSSPTIASVSDQMLEVCALCAGTLFFLSHARVMSGPRETAAVSHARGWGFCFSMVGIPLCLAQQLAAGVRPELMMGGIERLLMAVLAVYAGIFSCTVRPQRADR